jgi:hypothetical protein
MTREDNLYQDFLDLKVLYINGKISNENKITLSFLFIIKTRIYVIWLIMAGQNNILDN